MDWIALLLLFHFHSGLFWALTYWVYKYGVVEVVAVEVISACKLVSEASELCFQSSIVSPRMLEYPTFQHGLRIHVSWMLLGHVLRDWGSCKVVMLWILCSSLTLSSTFTLLDGVLFVFRGDWCVKDEKKKEESSGCTLYDFCFEIFIFNS